ncbi:isochorismatase family protein [Nocardioides sp. GXZ039]|uniref:isochorismatase family protein n=1 Tax=Nocardioides sp. GXZ039 TaxID=3136018 RepID=UPI0030F3FE3A
MTDPAACTALVVVDVQHAFLGADPPPADAAGLLAALTTLLGSARAAGATVIHIRDLGTADSRFPTTGAGRDLVLAVHPGEVVVEKTDDDAFLGTALAQELGGHEVIAVGGLQSEMCVAAMARGAIARGHRVVLPHDAHTTFDIPAGPLGAAVPAEHVKRVAAWSLGDGAAVVATAAEVRFRSRPDALRS